MAGPSTRDEALEHIKIEMRITLDDDTIAPQVQQEQIRQSWDYHMWLAGEVSGPFDS